MYFSLIDTISLTISLFKKCPGGIVLKNKDQEIVKLSSKAVYRSCAANLVKFYRHFFKLVNFMERK